MPDTVIESVLRGKLDSVVLLKWLNDEAIDEDCILLSCERSEFVACFLTYLRNQTDSILCTNTNAAQILQNSTPEKGFSSVRKHHRSISEPTSDNCDSLSIKTDKSHESPNRDRKRTGRKVKTKLFSEDRKDISVSSDESRLSTSIDRMAVSSTPIKNANPDFSNVSFSSPVTPRSFIKDGERCDTPRLSHRHSRSHEKSCLGDFIVSATKSKKKSKKSVSIENEEKIELDISNSEIFPEIGARKSSSLRGEKKRIKPTNIDKSQKSLSLNSFTSECFQQPSPLVLEENSAFKHQKFQPKETTNFEIERNILKQERHKLMEKFNILNTATPPKVATPQIKISQKESIEINQSYVKANAAKILLKDKIDLLIEIYNSLLKNNLILSVITEVYYLISIIISSQLEDDYLKAESNLNDNNIEYLLKSIHNSSYFAVKSLWNLRTTLEVILDKNSLKTLGENKKVRSFYPELAKFLLNVYCLRMECVPPPPAPRPPAVVCYNMETDSADNFPSTQAAHCAKRQRDMFYEIVRWYQDTQSTGASKSSFRARLKALASHGASCANHAHLATLFVQHLLTTCLTSDAQESKLSKLQRRLTCPTAPESHRLPNFTANEMFYKEFILNAEHESFRTHLRDALSTEVITLDATQFAVEDRGNSNSIDITREYLQLAKKLVLLAKFLGYLTSLPYSPIPTEIISKNNNIIVLNKEHNYVVPKEKVLENSIAMRNYTHPTIDIKSLLQNAIDNSRLSITIPWIIYYLSMLDYTTLHLNYYQNILKTLKNIYQTKLVMSPENPLKKNTIVYLKSIMGWLFDLPHYSEVELQGSSAGTDSIDSCELVDESIIELCPCLKDVNTLLSTCRFSQEQRDIGTFRHITPVSLNVDPQARSRNKEKELQARLEEELLKSQPSSSRRVLEMVIERVTSAAVRELTARDLLAARSKASEHVARMLASEREKDHASLLSKATSIYTCHLQQLRTSALESAKSPLVIRTRDALTALLPTAPAPLHSVASRAARNRLSNWIKDHWNTTTVLCKDIESEMRTLMSLNELRVPSIRAPSIDPNAMTYDESPANVLIQLKEHAYLLLSESTSPPPELRASLCVCVSVCAYNVYCRPPTRRAIVQLTVDLCVIYVAKKPKEITESFLQNFHAVWNVCCPDRKHFTPDNLSVMERREGLSPELRNFTDDRMPTPISDGDECVNRIDKIDANSKPIDPDLKPILPNSSVDSITPNSKFIKRDDLTGIDQNFIGVESPTKTESNSQSIETNTQSIIPNSPSLIPKHNVPNSPGFMNSKPTFKRITPISQPNSKPVSPNTIYHPISHSFPNSPVALNSPIIPNSPIFKSIESNSRNSDLSTNKPKVDSNTKQNESKMDQTTNEESNDHLLEFFDRILCPRNIAMLSASKCKQTEVWEALSIMLVFLLKNDYLSEDSLTEQCLSVYRQDWPQVILENLSTCMKLVSSNWRSSAGKFTLFLDFLAEYCGDMDYDITE